MKPSWLTSITMNRIHLARNRSFIKSIMKMRWVVILREEFSKRKLLKQNVSRRFLIEIIRLTKFPKEVKLFEIINRFVRFLLKVWSCGFPLIFTVLCSTLTFAVNLIAYRNEKVAEYSHANGTSGVRMRNFIFTTKTKNVRALTDLH